MAGLHSLFGPSSAHRIATCPASLLRTKDLPDTPSFEAVEGTVAHAIHEHVLLTGEDPHALVGAEPRALMSENDLSAAEWALLEGFVVPIEMAHYVQESVDWCLELPGQHFVEQRLSIDRWTPIPKQFGTADHIALSFEQRTLWVTDLKYGKGVQVFAERNPQLALYALATLAEFECFGTIDKVFIRVSQPRLDHRDVWETTPAELYEIGAYLLKRFTLALEPDAPFNPEKHACQFCKLKPTCPGLYERTWEIAQGWFDTLDGETTDPKIDGTWPLSTPSPHLICNEHLATLLDHADMIVGFLEDVKKHAMGLLWQGDTVPGYKIVQGRSNRAWTDAEAARQFAEARGVTWYKPREIISPAQAEEQLPKSAHKELAKWTRKPPGKPTLVPLTDKRPEFTPASADDMFDVLPDSNDL